VDVTRRHLFNEVTQSRTALEILGRNPPPHIRFDAKLSRFFDDFESTAVLCSGASARWRQLPPLFY